jgi:class 3 adenylate cyclase
MPTGRHRKKPGPEPAESEVQMCQDQASLNAVVENLQKKQGRPIGPPSQTTSGTFDCVDRTGVNTGSTVSAEFGTDGVLLLAFLDGVNRAGRQAGTTVDALVVNSMSQRNHLLFSKLNSREFKNRK